VRTLDRLADYSDESVLSELRRVARALGKDTLTRRDLSRARLSYRLLKERFGGLRKALLKAGLQSPAFHRDIPDEDLLIELQRVWDAVLSREGRNLQKLDLRSYGCKYSHHPYCRRWGSWVKACEALIVWEEDTAARTDLEPSQLPATEVTQSGGRMKRDVPLRVRYEVLRRDSFRCVLCGRSPATHPGIALHVDHVVPESKGGPTQTANLRTLCEECNVGKGNRV
jgi:hypothetical protein